MVNACENKKNKRKYIYLLLVCIIVCIIVFIVGYYLIQHFLIQDDMGQNDKGQDYLSRYIEPYLSNKYGTEIEKITYNKRNNCITTYSTVAGDSGSGRKIVKDCYNYYYDVTLKNNIKSKAYLFYNKGDIKVGDDITYSKLGNYLKKYQKSVGFEKINYLYYDPRYIANNASLEEKVLVIKINQTMKDTINKEFIEKMILLTEDGKNFIKQSNSNIEEITIVFEFNDYYYTFYNSSYKNGKIEIDKYSDRTIEEEIQDYTLSGWFYIYADATEEEIKWCIDNQKRSLDYKDYKVTKEVENILQKYNNIEFTVFHVEGFNEPRMLVYFNDFSDLNNIFDDLRNHGFLKEEKGHYWSIIITDNDDFYNNYNNYNGFEAINNVIDYAKEVSRVEGFNYQFYKEYLENNKSEYSVYFLIYTKGSKHCVNIDRSCTVLYGINGS